MQPRAVLTITLRRSEQCHKLLDFCRTKMSKSMSRSGCLYKTKLMNNIKLRTQYYLVKIKISNPENMTEEQDIESVTLRKHFNPKMG